MRGPLSIGGITRSLLRTAGAIALLAALVGATTLLAGVTTGSAQHAARHLAAHHFLKPTVSVDALYSPYLYPYPYEPPPTIDISGQNFTPGESLHLQLIASDGPDAGSVLVEGDTTASLDAYLTQADGQDVLVPGGQYTTRLTASSGSPRLCQAMTHAVVTVVGTVTGESASSNSVDISRWGCVLPAIVVANQDLHPWASQAFGAGFTPGGAVHIDLEMAFYPISTHAPDQRGPFQLAWSLDTTAATATYVWNSDGIVYTPGGYFAVTLGQDLADPAAVCQLHWGGHFDWYVVATDVATGRTATSPGGLGFCG